MNDGTAINIVAHQANDSELPGDTWVTVMPGILFFIQLAMNMLPGSSLAICPKTTNANELPSARASRTYSAVSHSCISENAIKF
ncbi:MAG TPA: hypothetical protein VFW07_27795 [Parafilimonas sp.]|nr:hypothetical protein [Parafilimonas sp.]